MCQTPVYRENKGNADVGVCAYGGESLVKYRYNLDIPSQIWYIFLDYGYYAKGECRDTKNT